MPRWPRALSLALAFPAAVGAALVLGGASATSDASTAPPAPATTAAAWRGLVGGSRPEVALGGRVIVVLKGPSLADRVRLAGGTATDAEERRWTASVLAGQQQFIAELAREGVVARPDLRFTRVLNGFSGIVDAKVTPLLERSPDVAGVFPVRAAFPAALGGGPPVGFAAALPRGLAPFRGRGVTLALLDTGVAHGTPFLHGRVLPGVDIVSRGPDARAVARPGGGALEDHGTHMAGLLVGLGGPGRPTGVAPDATLLPIRVAGWQRDAARRWSVHARTDQLIAGLERAVDPNVDGDAHDAARVTLVPLAEPFASFADGPLAQAVAGALALDSLVVAPAGNDGPGGPVFGSIAGPGGAPEALTVGATDRRPSSLEVSATVRAGLDVLIRRELALLNAVSPGSGTLRLVPLPAAAQRFDARGRSRVAGLAVLAEAGGDPRAAAVAATKAGAALVLLAGSTLPAGGLGADPALTVPVLEAPAGLGRLVDEADRPAWLSLRHTRALPGVGRGGPAAFSSSGLAFGGQPKPELLAPGVALATAEPGSDGRGGSRFLTTSGSSAAAAAVAGAAARLAQARPDLGAAGLRSALVGTARRGIDMDAAATVELVTQPAAVSFGRGSGDGWQSRRVLVVRNVSTRPMTVYASQPRRRSSGADVAIRPRRFRIESGRTALIRLRARAGTRRQVNAAIGVLRLTPVGGTPLVVPWSVALAPVPRDLIGRTQLSDRSFRPSDKTPAVLQVEAGRVVRAAGRDMLEPVLRLDVVLVGADRRPLGLLARLRDLLPGRYALGLTGRGPDGDVLEAGEYRLRLVAWPAGGGAPLRRVLRFRIE